MRISLLFLILTVLSAGSFAGGTEPSDKDRPPRDAVAEYCPGGVLEKPTAIYQPEPPAGLLWELCGGKLLKRVAARLDIDAEGRVEEVHLISGSGCPAVDAELERCWAKWRYRPARCNEVSIGIRVFFYTQWHRASAPAEPKADYCPSLEELESAEKAPPPGPAADVSSSKPTPFWSPPGISPRRSRE